MINTHDNCPRLEGKYVTLREVMLDDAALIIELRTSERAQLVLHHTDPDVEKQREYLRKYFAKNDEWYFIVEDRSGKAIGCFGVYGLTEDSAVTGRWVMRESKDPRPAIESKLLLSDFVYEQLGLDNVRTDTSEKNVAMQSLYRMLGCDELYRKDGIIYYNMPRSTYEKNKNKLLRFL